MEKKPDRIRTQVSEFDPDYIQARAVAHEVGLDTVFARDAQNKKDAEGESVKSAQELQQSFFKLATDLKGFLLQRRPEWEKKFVLKEIQEVFSIDLAQKELRENLGEDAEKVFAGNIDSDLAHRLASICAGGEISVETLYEMATEHSKRFEKKEAELHELVATTKSEFKQAVYDAVARGLLPQVAAESLHRIDAVKVQLKDKLADILSGSAGEAYDTGQITANSFQLVPERVSSLKRTLYHEFVHELAGKASIVVTFGDPETGESDHFLKHRKSGVAIRGLESSHGYHSWLNEAITEWLALELSGYSVDTEPTAYKGSDSYPAERKELDRLFDAGLKKEDVIQAYFENFVSSAGTKQGAQYKHLVSEINKIEGKSGFMKLENQHMMRKVESLLMSGNVLSSEYDEVMLSDNRYRKLGSLTMIIGKRPEVKVTKDFSVFVTQDSNNTSLAVVALARVLQKFENKVTWTIDQV